MTRQQTPLGNAAANGQMKVVDYLLSANANINHLSLQGLTPLYAAAGQGRHEIVKLLVKRGADIHIASIQGLTPLHHAALKGHKGVDDYLLKKGAEFEARGSTGKACKCCGATDVSLMRCAACRVVCYCNLACQKRDWREGHKVECATLNEMRRQYQENEKAEIERQKARFGHPSSN